MIPTEKERHARKVKRQEDAEEKAWLSARSSFELTEFPKTPGARSQIMEDDGPSTARGRWMDLKTAMTPRTLAFNQLEGSVRPER